MGPLCPIFLNSDDIYRKSRRCGGNSFVAFVFCISGLKTEIGLINDPYLWKVTGALLWLPLWVSS
jgi:hypothetical protein